MNLQADKTFTDDHRKLAGAVYRDLVKTYPQMTIEYVMNQAKFVADGNEPKGVGGVMLQDVYKRANLLK